MYHAGYSGSGLGSDGVSMDGYADLGNTQSLRSGGFLGQTGSPALPYPERGLPGTSPGKGYAYDDSGYLVSVPVQELLKPVPPPKTPLKRGGGFFDRHTMPIIAVAGVAVVGLGWWFLKR